MKCNYCKKDITLFKSTISSNRKHYCNLSCLKRKLKEGVEK